MVHIFTMTRGGRSLSVLARVVDGVYTLESINGFSADRFSPVILKRAMGRVSALSVATNKILAAKEEEIDRRETVDKFSNIDIEW